MKAILVGLGGRAHHWQSSCEEHPEVELVAFIETSEENRRRAIKERGVSEDLIFADLSDVPSTVEADFVVDVTPPAIHETIAMKAFDAGLNLLGEKRLSVLWKRVKKLT